MRLWLRAHSSRGYATRHVSSPRVTTTPPSNVRRNLAGSVSRLLSSIVWSWVPRSIEGPGPSLPLRPTLDHSPPLVHSSAPLASRPLSRVRCGRGNEGLRLEREEPHVDPDHEPRHRRTAERRRPARVGGRGVVSQRGPRPRLRPGAGARPALLRREDAPAPPLLDRLSRRLAGGRAQRARPCPRCRDA